VIILTNNFSLFMNYFPKAVKEAINTATILNCFYETVPSRNATGIKCDLAISHIQVLSISEAYAFSDDHIQKPGENFDRIGLYLPTPVSSLGQMYVAVLRARCWPYVKMKVSGADHRNR
jgi:hypothetical protein